MCQCAAAARVPVSPEANGRGILPARGLIRVRDDPTAAGSAEDNCHPAIVTRTPPLARAACSLPRRPGLSTQAGTQAGPGKPAPGCQ